MILPDRIRISNANPVDFAKKLSGMPKSDTVFYVMHKKLDKFFYFYAKVLIFF